MTVFVALDETAAANTDLEQAVIRIVPYTLLDGNGDVVGVAYIKINDTGSGLEASSPLDIGDGLGASTLRITGSPSTDKQIQIRSRVVSSTTRLVEWALRVLGTTRQVRLQRYGPDGVFIANTITIDASTGAIQVEGAFRAASLSIGKAAQTPLSGAVLTAGALYTTAERDLINKLYEIAVRHGFYVEP